MAKFSFTKAHGLGNDFILATSAAAAAALHAGAEAEAPLRALSRRLCDRRTGIGADGLALVCPATQAGADVRMRIFNSDGSEAEMCGNATRCFAKYVYERGLVRREKMTVETLSGLREVLCTVERDDPALPHGRVSAVTVCMGKPEFLCDGPKQARVLDKTLDYYALRLGVPHAVVPVEDPTDRALMRYGAAMEWAAPFPEGTNVDFIRVLDEGNILMRVWERGCGETLCCGTGASASAAAMRAMGLVGGEVRVHLALGALDIRCAPDGSVWMRGPAELVFEGEMEL